MIAVGTGAFLLLGFDTIKKLLLELGIGQSPEGKDYEEQLANPYSFWNPAFWTKGPAGTLLLKDDYCQWLYSEINNSFSMWGDDEARIYAAFKTLRTQSQLSFFADWMQKKKGTDLLKWLKGSDYGPWGDHLSVAEIAILTDYFSKLPKYKV